MRRTILIGVASFIAGGLLAGLILGSQTKRTGVAENAHPATSPGRLPDAEEASPAGDPLTSDGGQASQSSRAIESDAGNQRVRATEPVSVEFESNRNRADSQTATSSNVRIPEQYLSMVKIDPLPAALTTQEQFNVFSEDARDESWAYPMEEGINQYIAQQGAEINTLLEYVECRSRFCTIAGVVTDGGQANVNRLLSGITQSGWWQTHGGASTVGSSSDSGYRFVTVFPREHSDTQR